MWKMLKAKFCIIQLQFSDDYKRFTGDEGEQKNSQVNTVGWDYIDTENVKQVNTFFKCVIKLTIKKFTN